MKPATSLLWVVGEYDDSLGYDCMTGGIRAGPVVLDASNYGQENCIPATPETMRKLMADATYIVHACNAYPRLVEALRDVMAPETTRTEEQFVAAMDKARALLKELGE